MTKECFDLGDISLDFDVEFSDFLEFGRMLTKKIEWSWNEGKLVEKKMSW